jgi:hypothetical protein
VGAPTFLLLLLALLVTLKLGVIDRVPTPLRPERRFQGGSVTNGTTFGDEFVLLGHEELPARVPSGGEFVFQSYWRALEAKGPDYGVKVVVRGPQGHRWNDVGRVPRWHRAPPPTREWPPEGYASIVLSVPLRPGTPPGTYTVEVVAFDEDTLAPLTAHDTSGRPLGPALALGQIAVTRPPRPPAVDAPERAAPLATGLGPLALLTADLDRAAAAPGDPVLVTFLWQCAERPTRAYTVELTLRDSAGAGAATYPLPPTTASHPTTTWRPGDVWRGQHLVYLPAGLESDTYHWEVGLTSGGEHVELPAELTIEAPKRTFSRPAMDHPVDTPLGETVTLVGFDAPSAPLEPGRPLTVTLAWRAEAETRISYHVFVHLLGPEGGLVAQSDGVPARWSRPTTGWAAGEYVLDPHTLTLPADAPGGPYTLVAGMYRPGAARLKTPEGQDIIELYQVQEKQ